MYYSGITETGSETGWKFVAHDVFRGQIDSADIFGPLIWMPDLAGKNLFPGMKYSIQWHSENIASSNFYYSTDGGISWNPAQGISFLNCFLWTVPQISSSNCKIRIVGKDRDDNSIISISDGLFTISGPTGVSDRADASPRPFITASNHPNPFNPSTTIRYTLGMPGTVAMTVYNAVVQRVIRCNLGHKERGAHEFVFEGAGLTSGLYFYRIATENAATTGKMLLVR